eukprot:763318-Hanusia_phi.AAC.14
MRATNGLTFLSISLVLLQEIGPGTSNEIAKLGFDDRAAGAHHRSTNLNKKLHETCHHSEDDVAVQEARALLQQGANPNGPDAEHFFYTPLFHAVNRKLVNTTKVLIAHHANVNQPNRLGFKPLHIAAMSASVECMLLLLKAGADINAKTVFGCDAYNVAVQFGHMNAALHLLELMCFDPTAMQEYERMGVDLKLEHSTLRKTIQDACCENHAAASMKQLMRSEIVGLVLPLDLKYASGLDFTIARHLRPGRTAPFPRDFEKYWEHSSKCSVTDSSLMCETDLQWCNEEDWKAADFFTPDSDQSLQLKSENPPELAPERPKTRRKMRSQRVRLEKRSEYNIEHGDTVREYEAVHESSSGSDKVMNYLRKESAKQVDEDMSSGAENRHMFELLVGKEEARSECREVTSRIMIPGDVESCETAMQGISNLKCEHD